MIWDLVESMPGSGWKCKPVKRCRSHPIDNFKIDWRYTQYNIYYKWHFTLEMYIQQRLDPINSGVDQESSDLDIFCLTESQYTQRRIGELEL